VGAVEGPTKGANPNLCIEGSSANRPLSSPSQPNVRLQGHGNPPSIGIPDIRQQSSSVRQRTTRKRSAQEPKDQDGGDVLTERATDLKPDVPKE
jgi:hypothetical protein